MEKELLEESLIRINYLLKDKRLIKTKSYEAISIYLELIKYINNNINTFDKEDLFIIKNTIIMYYYGITRVKSTNETKDILDKITIQYMDLINNPITENIELDNKYTRIRDK